MTQFSTIKENFLLKTFLSLALEIKLSIKYNLLKVLFYLIMK